MPTKRPHRTPVRSPRVGQSPERQTAEPKTAACSAAGASRPPTFQVGELWDERERAFFAPYFGWLRHRLSAGSHPAR